MDYSCPGRISNASVESTMVPCPSCGRTVEIFGDEEKFLCRCGTEVFREARPSCFQWCKNAAACGGKIETRGTRYQEGLRRAFEKVREQTDDRLVKLGAQRAGEKAYTLAVLDGIFSIDLARGLVCVLPDPGGSAAGKMPPVEWQILALHYLNATGGESGFSRWISFADIPDARGYEKVYRGRVLGRFLRTAGKDSAVFARAARALNGRRVSLGDEGFEFPVFPGLSVILAWFRGDDELAPSASFLYPDTIHAMLAVEDIVVLSELLVARLYGEGW